MSTENWPVEAMKALEKARWEKCCKGEVFGILSRDEGAAIIAAKAPKVDVEKLATGLADRLIDGDFYPLQDEICGDPEDANYGSTNEQYRDRLIDDFTAHLDGGES